MEENSPKTTHFPTGKGEFWLLPGMILIGVLLMDLLFYYGCNLGFAVVSVAGILVSAVYVLRKAPRVSAYSVVLVICAVITAASLLRSDDALVKAVTVMLVILCSNLGLCLAAGKNRRNPAGVTSLLDAPMALFTLGFGQMHNAWGGLRDSMTEAGPAGKNRTAVFLGLLAAIPVVAVLVPLLMSADAAFEGMLNLLPKFDFIELIVALMFGVPLGIVLYTRNTALKHGKKAEDSHWTPRQCNPLTVSTVLIAICVVYLAYLVSQLAYFVGGFSGILPQGFTVAEYARRGFFEMAWLSIINLVIITAAVALCEKKDGRTPLMIRLLCLFVGLVTLFFAAASSAKMLHYIATYGMTRLRLLTQVIIIFIALAVIYVLVWLFRAKFAYMKAILLTAMLMASAVAWTDVDTVVAAYNVRAYQSGKLESIDISHLRSLGDGAVPYLQELTEDPNERVADAAKQALSDRAIGWDLDIRGWNLAAGTAREILVEYQQKAAAMEKTESEILDAAERFPLRNLMQYVDVAQSARDLTAYYPEAPWQGEVLTLTLKDTTLYFPDGTPFFDAPVSYDTLYQLEASGVTAVEVTACCILFRTDQAPEGAMVWTEEPDPAKSQLSGLYPGMTLTSAGYNWYVMILPALP